MASSAIVHFSNNNLVTALQDLPLGGVHYYDSIDSTNNAALEWVNEGAPDQGLVIANKQTAGRGRGKRIWYTPPDAALAFSLILRPRPEPKIAITLFSGLGALAVCYAISNLYKVNPIIKWPNDVLINDRKFCGILTETSWVRDELESIILGIGVNVSAQSVPPADLVSFPATCLEYVLGVIPDRLVLLHEILGQLLLWRSGMTSPRFVKSWDQLLAYKGQQVEIRGGDGSRVIGILDGLEADGCLRIKKTDGLFTIVQSGDMHLRIGI